MINLITLSKCLPETDCVSLKRDLISFPTNFEHLKQRLFEYNSDEESYKTGESYISDEEGEIPEDNVAEKSVKKIAC